MDEKSCSNFEHELGERCSTCGAMLLMIAKSAGYTVFSFPLLAVIKV